jgi:predicted RecA/RadA family phage recombinase
MKIYIGRGDSINIIAPFNLTSGQGLQVKNLFGIVGADAVLGAQVALHVEGEYQVPKTSTQVWAVGDLVYFDNDLKVITNVNVSGSVKIGVATEIALNPSATGKIRLNGAF